MRCGEAHLRVPGALRRGGLEEPDLRRAGGRRGGRAKGGKGCECGDNAVLCCMWVLEHGCYARSQATNRVWSSYTTRVMHCCTSASSSSMAAVRGQVHATHRMREPLAAVGRRAGGLDQTRERWLAREPVREVPNLCRGRRGRQQGPSLEQRYLRMSQSARCRTLGVQVRTAGERRPAQPISPIASAPPATG